MMKRYSQSIIEYIVVLVSVIFTVMIGLNLFRPGVRKGALNNTSTIIIQNLSRAIVNDSDIKKTTFDLSSDVVDGNNVNIGEDVKSSGLAEFNSSVRYTEDTDVMNKRYFVDYSNLKENITSDIQRFRAEENLTDADSFSIGDTSLYENTYQKYFRQDYDQYVFNEGGTDMSRVPKNGTVLREYGINGGSFSVVDNITGRTHYDTNLDIEEGPTKDDNYNLQITELAKSIHSYLQNPSADEASITNLYNTLKSVSNNDIYTSDYAHSSNTVAVSNPEIEAQTESLWLEVLDDFSSRSDVDDKSKRGIYYLRKMILNKDKKYGGLKRGERKRARIYIRRLKSNGVFDKMIEEFNKKVRMKAEQEVQQEFQ